MSPDAVLQAFPFLYPLFVGLLGLIVGSFLNVVILRLPVMMERQWRRDCAALLAGGEDAPAPVEDEAFSLAFPASHCPQFHAPVRA